MKYKFMNIKITVLGLALLMVDAEPVLAATVSLNGGTGTSCTYNEYSADLNGNLQVTCTTGQTNPGAPVCTLTANPSTISSGGSSQLTAVCSGSPTSYSWTGPGTSIFSPTTSSGSVSPTSTTTYTVAGTNTVAGNAVSAVVTVSTPSQTPGNLPAGCKIVDLTWPTGGLNLKTTPQQHMLKGQMFAFRTTVPAGRALVRSGTEYAEVPKYMSISTNACDFNESLKVSKCMNGARTNDPLIWNTTESTAYCQLPPAGTTVYFNIKNSTSSTGPDTCADGQDCKYYFYW